MLNIYRKASPKWKSENYISIETGLITSITHYDWNIPWHMINMDSERLKYCALCHDLFHMYDIVPPHCLDCWKVVVRPRKHSELIRLRHIMLELKSRDLECWCKCGIEMRPYVRGLYGGYFYNDGKDEGLYRLKQIEEIVWTQISADVPVYLKRYCTEFENKLGDSSKYESPEWAEGIQKNYFSKCEKPKFHCKQPQIVLTEVEQGWLEYGWKYGTDEDRKEIEDTYNDGKPLYPIPRTYKEYHENVQKLERKIR